MTATDQLDWLFCGLTTAVTALYNLVKVLRQIWTHIAVLALFAGFIAWNGGVVLGESSSNPRSASALTKFQGTNPTTSPLSTSRRFSISGLCSPSSPRPYSSRPSSLPSRAPCSISKPSSTPTPSGRL